MSDKTAKQVIVHARTCIGCQNHNADVMITLMEKSKPYVFHDWFLTQDQAEKLHDDLGKIIARNQHPND